MSLNSFCEFIKENYPDISSKADNIYNKYWNHLVEMEFSPYSWFEALANALNEEMRLKEFSSVYVELLDTISQEYRKGSAEVEKAIDVAFVENLYFHVAKDSAEPFWVIMPDNLKCLYVSFHGRTPT